MEKRFTVKDFFLFLALGVVVVMVLLAMYMVDRQWTMMSRMRQIMTEQADDLRAVRSDLKALQQRIASGALRTAPDPRASAASEEPSVFRRAIAATELPDFASGDWLVSAFGTGLKTISPLVSSDAYASEVQSYVLESLLSRNPDTLEWQGLVADSWAISDDGLTIDFSLRDGTTFSDGKPLTADDVAFTFDFIMDEAIAAPRQRAYLEKLESVVANGPRDVRFQFKEPYFNALSLAGQMAIMPRHFYERFREDPTRFNESKGLLMGSGPYRLADPEGWTPDQGLVELERNPRYWGPVQPSFSRVIWRVIENASARLTTFRNGDIDSYGARAREFQELLDDEQLRARTQSFEFMNPIAGYSYIGWNQQRGGEPTRFADRRVREAMTFLTDRERIIDEIMLGFAEIAISPFSPRSAQHDPAIEPRPFDPARAEALLAEAGYADRDGDGVLESETGEPFEFDLVYFQDSEDTKRIVLFLKDLYARAGVLLQPKPTEWSVMIDLHRPAASSRPSPSAGPAASRPISTRSSTATQIKEGGDNFVQLQPIRRAGPVHRSRPAPPWTRASACRCGSRPSNGSCLGGSALYLPDAPRRRWCSSMQRHASNLEVTNLRPESRSFVPVEIFVPLANCRRLSIRLKRRSPRCTTYIIRRLLLMFPTLIGITHRGVHS